MKNNQIEEAEIVNEVLIDEISITLSEKDFPEIIKGQIDKLNELNASIRKAEEASRKAENSAIRAKNKVLGIIRGKKDAIEELQNSGIDLADAIQIGIESQKISFEFNKKLSDITKYLFGLGANDIANNRFVINNLKKMFEGASKKELSDLAHQELLLVIKQLEEQQDILEKQEKTSKNISILRNDLNEQNRIGTEKFNYLYEKFNEIKNDLSNQYKNTSEKLNELDIRYTELVNLINSQNEETFIKFNSLEIRNKNSEDKLGILNKNLHDINKKIEVKEKDYEESKDFLKESINNLFNILEKNNEIISNQHNEFQILKEKILSLNKKNKIIKVNMTILVVIFVISIIYMRV